MNAMNDIVNTQLKAAMAALHVLDDAGATVLNVALGDRRPVITIDSAPASVFVRGALHARVRIGNHVRRTMAASVHGCQVEWQESHAIKPPAARVADDDELPPVLGEALRDLADPYRLATRDDAP